jgi:biopolymer transport protein ExbB
MHKVITYAQQLWLQAESIWLAGGWTMVAIAAVAVLMFALGLHIQLKLWLTRFQSVRESTWRRWIDHPSERTGPIGRMLDSILTAPTVHEAAIACEELRAVETHPFDRDLKVMMICISAAPLLGLFGTVTGMLTTFGALASGAGGEKTMARVAEGISEALITTETGLVIALPGLLFQYQLSRTVDRYRAFLTHLETVCTQRIYRRGHAISTTQSVNPRAATALMSV